MLHHRAFFSNGSLVSSAAGWAVRWLAQTARQLRKTGWPRTGLGAESLPGVYKLPREKSVALEKQSSKEEKKRQRKEQIHSQAQKVLASGKDPAAMTKGDLDILLKEKGIKAGADKATSYDLYLNSL